MLVLASTFPEQYAALRTLFASFGGVLQHGALSNNWHSLTFQVFNKSKTVLDIIDHEANEIAYPLPSFALAEFFHLQLHLPWHCPFAKVLEVVCGRVPRE